MCAKKIPDILTLCNLLCGCLSVVYAFGGHLAIAAIFIFVASVFDFFDGMAARLLDAKSSLGRELDSLSDVVSFGVAPAALVYIMLLSQPEWGHYWACVAFVMTAASAYRLAKFNVAEESGSFRGMPTPANAIFWASLALHADPDGVFLKGGCLLALVVVMSLLLVCNYRMFSFKLKHLSWQGQKVVYLFIATAIVLFALFGFLGLAVTIFLYPFFSWVHFYMEERNTTNKNIE